MQSMTNQWPKLVTLHYLSPLLSVIGALICKCPQSSWHDVLCAVQRVLLFISLVTLESMFSGFHLLKMLLFFKFIHLIKFQATWPWISRNTTMNFGQHDSGSGWHDSRQHDFQTSYLANRKVIMAMSARFLKRLLLHDVQFSC